MKPKALLSKWIIRFVIGFILVILLLILIATGAYTYRAVAIKYKTSTLDLENTPQIWAHRGYRKGLPENSLDAFRKAFEVGATGVELDAHFDQVRDRFLITHDAPHKIQKTQLISLADVFKSLGKAGYYWIDLKNLSTENLEQVSGRLRHLLDKHDLKKLVFIESQNGDNLSQLSKRGFQTIFWLAYNWEPGSLTHLGELHRRRGVLLKSDFSAISCSYATFVKYADTMANYPVFIFTVNQRADLEKFRQNSRIKVILTNNDAFYRTGNH
jgi:hypothetical protein